MNWTHRRPFRHQLNYGNKLPLNRPGPFRERFPLSKPRAEQPIDAIRLQLADYDHSRQRCPVHHPYITTFSDQQSSIRRTRSSIHSVSTIETDFVHQRVSTIHTYPSSPSIIERQEILDEDNQQEQQQQLQIEHHPQELTESGGEEEEEEEEQSSQCRNCSMLMDIVDQQAQQIRQYTEQISQQADLLAKLARRLAGFEEQKPDSDHNHPDQTTS